MIPPYQSQKLVVLSRSLDQVIEVGCCWVVKVYSSDGKFKMLVELVLTGSDYGGDFEAKFLKRFNKSRNGFVFPDKKGFASARRSEIVCFQSHRL